MYLDKLKVVHNNKTFQKKKKKQNKNKKPRNR